ncbi:unnamed protein product, partial [Schistocephalus solidus]|uniref:C2H2-type domain-containing protein n=1 Tax=Schistocephalus solidus TaxID=70667 RepID=A0A183TU67_SCHSO
PAIYEANRIAAAKAKRAARKSPAPRTNIVDAKALPTCTRCQRIFHARIGLVGHLRMQCTNNPTIPISTSNSANPPSDSPTLTRGINSITPTIIETTSIYSSPVTPTTAQVLVNSSTCTTYMTWPPKHKHQDFIQQVVERLTCVRVPEVTLSRSHRNLTLRLPVSHSTQHTLD